MQLEGSTYKSCMEMVSLYFSLELLDFCPFRISIRDMILKQIKTKNIQY